jgi:hypothetical protein
MNANPKHYFVDCSNILKFYWFLIGETWTMWSALIWTWFIGWGTGTQSYMVISRPQSHGVSFLLFQLFFFAVLDFNW